MRNEVGFLDISKWDSAKAIYSKDQTDVENYPSNLNSKTSILKRETNSEIGLDQISLSYENIINIKLPGFSIAI